MTVRTDGLRVHGLPDDHTPRALRDGSRDGAHRRRERRQPVGGDQRRRHPRRRHRRGPYRHPRRPRPHLRAPGGGALLPPAGARAVAALPLRGAVRGDVLHDGAASLDAGRPTLRARAPRRDLRRGEPLPPQRGSARIVRRRARLRRDGQLSADLPPGRARRRRLGDRHVPGRRPASTAEQGNERTPGRPAR